MKALRSLLLAAAMTVTARAVTAQSTVHFTSPGNVTAFGYYIGQYQGTIDGSPADLFCVDFLHHVSVGQTWQANLTSLTGGDLSNTRGGAGALVQYEEAAWLTQQYGSVPTSQWGDIQATIWDIFAPSSTPGLPHPSASSTWLAQAQAAIGSYDFTNFVIVTDVNFKTGGTQEFITTTPEPAEMMLLGTGLGIVALTGFVRKRIV